MNVNPSSHSPFTCKHLTCCLKGFTAFLYVCISQDNTGYPYEPFTGNDNNVEGAWLQGLTGCGVTVAVVDDGKIACSSLQITEHIFPGVDHAHQDLRPGYVSLHS